MLKTGKILFQNSNLVVVDKYSGVLTVPSRQGEQDLRLCLGIELQEFLNTQIFPVHRLDFEVSGLVLFALNFSTQKILNQLFEQRQITKTYQCLTEKQVLDHWPENLRFFLKPFNPEVGPTYQWTCRLLRGKKRSYESSHGDLAQTEAQFLGEGRQDETNLRADSILKWILHPLTGRAHQLRYEMSRHGFPILGDSLYGSRQKWWGSKNIKSDNEERIALRAVKLDFLDKEACSKLEIAERIEVEGLWSN